MTETVMEGGTATDYLDVYRTSDWTLERRAHVPDLIHYQGNVPSGIAASPDGRFVYVYNYNDRTRGSSPVQYWITIFDVSTGAWLPQRVDLPNCGASQLLSSQDGLFALCSESRDVRLVDPQRLLVAGRGGITPVAAHSGPGLTSLASGVVSGNNLIAVTENREVHILRAHNPGSPAQVHEAIASSEKVVPFQPSGLQGSLLFVPSGSAEERSHGLASRLVVVDTRTGALVRTIQPTRPFRWVTFADDARSGVLALADPDTAANALVGIDLQTGAETTLVIGGRVGPGFVMSH